MSAASEMAKQMIVCERGLGKLLPKTCARRWRIANDKEAGDVGFGRECIQCPAGEQRADGADLPTIRTTARNANFVTGDLSRCKCCGEQFGKKGRAQKFCVDAVCKKRRTALTAKRAKEKYRGDPVTPWPWEGVKPLMVSPQGIPSNESAEQAGILPPAIPSAEPPACEDLSDSPSPAAESDDEPPEEVQEEMAGAKWPERPPAAAILDPDPDFATIDEACRFLIVSRHALYKMMDDGRLKTIPHGRVRRISWKALREFNALSPQAPREETPVADWEHDLDQLPPVVLEVLDGPVTIRVRNPSQVTVELVDP